MNKYNPLPNNPYFPQDAFTVSGMEAFGDGFFQRFLASFDWSLDGSYSMEIEPVTGHLYGDLDYYRVTVSDGTKEVVGQMNLTTRDIFSLNLAPLDKNKPWLVRFAGSRGSNYLNDGNTLDYEFKIPSPPAAANGQTNTTVPSPDIWSNIELTLVLDSTTDISFANFPEGGLLVKRGDVVDMNQYSTSGNLVNAEDYIFKVYVQRKDGLDAGLSSESLSGAVTATSPTFPFPVGVKRKELYGDFQLDTTAVGGQNISLNYGVSNGGVLNFTNFQIAFTVV